MSNRPEDQVELFRAYQLEEVESRHSKVALGLVKPPIRGHDSSGGIET